jgi:hypothetical protein
MTGACQPVTLQPNKPIKVERVKDQRNSTPIAWRKALREPSSFFIAAKAPKQGSEKKLKQMKAIGS